MPSRFRLRRVFRGVVLAIARPLASRGVNPDAISYLTLLTAYAGGLLLLLFQHQPVFGVFVFLTGLFDGVDGAVARLSGRSSPMGPLLDSVVDKVAEVTLILFIALSLPEVVILGVSVPVWCVLCVSGWLLTSYTRCRAESLGVSDLDIGLGARSERLFTLFVFSVFWLLRWGLVVVTLLGIGTAAYRFRHYSEELQQATRSDLEQA